MSATLLSLWLGPRPRRRHVRRVVALSLSAGALALFAPAMLTIVERLGHSIPTKNMANDYVIGLVWAFALGLTIFLWPIPSRHKTALAVLWVVRCLTTLGIALLFEWHYSADAFGYFYYGRFLPQHMPMNGTHNIFRLTSYQLSIIPDSYHALKVSFSMVGLIACYLFYRAAVLYLGREDIRVLFAINLFPSIVFWSSIVGKDPVVLLGMAMNCVGVLAFYRYRRLSYLWVLPVGGTILWLVRPWMVLIVAIALVWFLLRGVRSTVLKLVLLVGVAIVLIAVSTPVFRKLSIDSTSDVFRAADTVARLSPTGGSGQRLETRLTSTTTFARFVPLGMFTALFRPLPFEVASPFAWLPEAENVLLLVLFFLAVVRIRPKDLADPILSWALVLIFTWTVWYAPLSYQNLGSAVRYRNQILPILLCVLLYLSRPRLMAEPGDLRGEHPAAIQLHSL